MSLQTDSIFVAALGADETLMEAVGGRLYGTAIPLPDEDADNVPAPYIVVTFDGMQNAQTTKDDGFEGYADEVQIGVLIVAKTLEGLHELTEEARTAVKGYFEEHLDDDLTPMDYALSAGPIQYDSWKPAYFQTLSYNCSTEV